MCLNTGYFIKIKKLLLKVFYIKISWNNMDLWIILKNTVELINTYKNKLNSKIIFIFHSNPDTH